MSTANNNTESGELEVGIIVVVSDGETIARRFLLRPARLADSYKAAACVPIPADIATNTPARVAYQMAVDDAGVLCQIVELGDLKEIPPPNELADLIDPDDMGILRAAAERLKKKLRPSKDGLLPAGLQSASLSAPGST